MPRRQRADRFDQTTDMTRRQPLYLLGKPRNAIVAAAAIAPAPAAQSQSRTVRAAGASATNRDDLTGAEFESCGVSGRAMLCRRYWFGVDSPIGRRLAESCTPDGALFDIKGTQRKAKNLNIR